MDDAKHTCRGFYCRETDECPHCGECVACGVRDCPSKEPLHYHHDGCPACSRYADELKNQVFVCDCGFKSDEPDYWQDHAETCPKAPNPYEVCWCKHQRQAHYTPDLTCGSPFGCDCKGFVRNDERRDGT